MPGTVLMVKVAKSLWNQVIRVIIFAFVRPWTAGRKGEDVERTLPSRGGHSADMVELLRFDWLRVAFCFGEWPRITSITHGTVFLIESLPTFAVLPPAPLGSILF